MFLIQCVLGGKKKKKTNETKGRGEACHPKQTVRLYVDNRENAASASSGKWLVGDQRHHTSLLSPGRERAVSRTRLDSSCKLPRLSAAGRRSSRELWALRGGTDCPFLEEGLRQQSDSMSHQRKKV